MAGAHTTAVPHSWTAAHKTSGEVSPVSIQAPLLGGVGIRC